MEFTLIASPLSKGATWRNIHRVAQGQSMQRALEFVRLEQLNFPCRLLDFGAGTTAGHAQWPASAPEILSVNTDQKLQPTHAVHPAKNLTPKFPRERMLSRDVLDA